MKNEPCLFHVLIAGDQGVTAYMLAATDQNAVEEICRQFLKKNKNAHSFNIIQIPNFFKIPAMLEEALEYGRVPESKEIN